MTPYSHYDRFSPMDAAFLDLEDSNAHMQVGSIGIFDARALTKPGGGLDFDRIVGLTEAALRKRNRFQQKVAYIPALAQPVWIDDDKFNLRYHLRHTCLPAPGDIRLLKRLAGRIMSEVLDRGKPLWELWFVEGVEEDRFAVISKIHNCMIAGVAGFDLLSVVMGPEPDYRPQPAGSWMPRPAPGPGRLLLDELGRRANMPRAMLRAGGRAVSAPRKTLGFLRDAAVGVAQVAKASWVPASETPFNEPLGPHRRLDWTRLPLDEVTKVRERLGATLDDVVLAMTAGAVRRFFLGRGLPVDDLDFRALVPTNIRPGDTRGSLASRIATLLARLPVEERDPRRRLERVIETTRAFKKPKQRQSGEIIAEIAEWTYSGLMVQFARMGLHKRAANLVVTSVVGPPEPVYLLGAQLREVYPVVPLGSNQTLSVALFIYAGSLHWGFNADWDVLPDLHDFVEAIEMEFAELSAVAGPRPGASAVAEEAERESEAGVDGSWSTG